MKTGQTSLSVVQVNYAFDNELSDPDALLERFTTLTGWSEAVRAAGARGSAVVQRFHRPARLIRNGIEYVFVDRDVPRAVAAMSPDIAHVNGIVFPVRTWMLRRALSPHAAIVVQNHSDTGPMGRAPALRMLARATRGAVDAYLFAADEHVARWHRAGFIEPGRRTYQVMEASTMFTPTPRDDAQNHTGIGGTPALLWVGRLNANKDPLTVLDGFERSLQRHLPAATLTMIFGTAELLEDVRARIEGSSVLRDRVRLIGAVPQGDMPMYFSAADLFIVGSHHEGSGYSLMEALACGVTPVVTDIPTFRLLTGGGSVGTLWTPGDAADCARALVSAAGRDFDGDRPLVRDHFARHFSWAAIGRRAMEIYHDVVACRASLHPFFFSASFG